MKLKDVIFPKMPHNFMSKRKTRPCLRPAKRMDRHLNLKGLKKNNGFGFWVFFLEKKGEAINVFLKDSSCHHVCHMGRRDIPLSN